MHAYHTQTWERRHCGAVVASTWVRMLTYIMHYAHDCTRHEARPHLDKGVGMRINPFRDNVQHAHGEYDRLHCGARVDANHPNLLHAYFILKKPNEIICDRPLRQSDPQSGHANKTEKSMVESVQDMVAHSRVKGGCHTRGLHIWCTADRDFVTPPKICRQKPIAGSPCPAGRGLASRS